MTISLGNQRRLKRFKENFSLNEIAWWN